MPDLFRLTGLPGSGKSTLAREMLLGNNTVRVNRDELRLMLHGDQRWSKGRENATGLAEVAIVKAALDGGQHVIVDAMHVLGDGWEAFVAKENTIREDRASARGSEHFSRIRLKTISLTNVPVPECVRRDALRQGTQRVGRGVTQGQAIEIDQRVLDLGHVVALVNPMDTAKTYQAERIAEEMPRGRHVLHCIGTTYGNDMTKAVIMDCYEVE